MLTLEQINKIRASTGDKPLTSIGVTQSKPTQSLSERLGIAPKAPIGPTFKASIGGAETILPNIAKIAGNVPSDVGSAIETAFVDPAKKIQESEKVLGDIYKNRGAVQGTKDIAGGFADTLTKIGEAPGKLLVGQADKQDLVDHLAPIQEQTIKQRDEILKKLDEAKKTGKDTSTLIKALKFSMESLDSINSQIGTKEDRKNKEIQDYTNVAKYPIEHPVQTAIAAETLKPETQASLADKIKPITSKIEGAVDATTNTITGTKNAIVNRLGLSDASQIKKVKAQWLEPTTKPKASYNKATDIFKDAKRQGNDVGETLVNKLKISPTDNIDGKTYNTTDTVEQIRRETGLTSGDLLRPSLEQASYTTPKVPIADVEQEAVASVMRDKRLADKEAIVAKIKRRFESTGQGSLQEQYPEGFDLTNLHDQKITNSMDVNFNNPDKDANYHISQAFKKQLEKSAPKEIPVKAFNDELQKNYQAADYLEALHGKTAPQSLVKKTGVLVGKIAGAGLGNALGGGLLGGVGGYHLGGALISAFESIPNPLKEAALRSLQVNKPGVYQALENYLGTAEMNRLTGLKLPAPSKIPATIELPGEGILKGQENLRQSSSLDQSGSVKKPITTESKNINIKSTIPKSTLKVKSRKGGYINLEEIAKSIDNADKVLMLKFVDLVNSGKTPSKTLLVNIQKLADTMDLENRFGTNKKLARDMNTILDMERQITKSKLK